MRVLHLGKFYPPHRGGMETHLQTLAQGLAKEVEIRIIAFHDRPFTETTVDGNIKIVRAGTIGTVASLPLSAPYLREVRRNLAWADIVHLHHPNPLANLAVRNLKAHTPLVVTWHSDIVRQRIFGAAIAPLLEFTWRRSAAILVNSYHYLETSKVLRKHRSRCHVVPLGIDVDPLGQIHKENVKHIHAKYGNRLILAVGRLVGYKGFDYLIDAMRNVDGRLLLIGTGPLHNMLQARIRAGQLQDKVTLLSHVDDVTAYYQACNLLAVPSVTRAEAFALVQVEAMACGKPVINTAIDSGVPEVSLDGMTGITVPPKDSEALASAISLLLEQPDLCIKYGEAGKQRARREFSATKMVDNTLSVYEQVRAKESRPVYASSEPTA